MFGSIRESILVLHRSSLLITLLVLAANLSGGGGARAANDSLELIALEGQAISAEPDAPLFAELQRRPALNESGQVSFSSQLFGSTWSGAFLWSRTQGVVPVLVGGDPAPAPTQPGIVSVEEDITPWLSDAGDIGTGGSVNVAPPPGAQVGGSAGSALGDATIWALDETGAVSNHGWFHFTGAYLQELGNNQFTIGDVLWVTTPGGSLEVVLAEGLDAPGFAAGEQVRRIEQEFALNKDGVLAAFGEVGDGRIAALWLDERSGPVLLLREGDPAPGFPQETVASLGGEDDLRNIAMNSSGGRSRFAVKRRAASPQSGVPTTRAPLRPWWLKETKLRASARRSSTACSTSHSKTGTG